MTLKVSEISYFWGPGDWEELKQVSVLAMFCFLIWEGLHGIVQFVKIHNLSFPVYYALVIQLCFKYIQLKLKKNV